MKVDVIHGSETQDAGGQNLQYITGPLNNKPRQTNLEEIIRYRHCCCLDGLYISALVLFYSTVYPFCGGGGGVHSSFIYCWSFLFKE